MTKFNDVTAQWREIEKEALPELLDLFRNGPYMNGANLKAFESAFAAWCGTKHAIGVSNGTDGLKLALQALELESGTTVIMAANAYIADALAAEYLELLDIRFVDCDKWYGIDVKALQTLVNSFPVDRKVVVLAVHLYGQPCDIQGIKRVCPNALIIEDCSQAAGATINRTPIGSFGDMGVFSLYPTKNLGAIGDAGIIVTNNDDYSSRLRMLREYGTIDKIDYTATGWNHRLDEVQALILRHKLPHVKRWNTRKSVLAAAYALDLLNVGDIVLPEQAPWADNHTRHLYPIRTEHRDDLQIFLAQNGIPTIIHYPRPLHKTTVFYRDLSFPKAEHFAETILSLPIHPYMKSKEVHHIAMLIKRFFKEKNLPGLKVCSIKTPGCGCCFCDCSKPHNICDTQQRGAICPECRPVC